MLSSIKQLRRFKISAADGEIGRIKDVYFDDQRWAVEYFLVDTEEWLLRRRVLIGPTAVRNVDWDARRVCVELTKEQVRASPDIDNDKLTSRRREHVGYYGQSYCRMAAKTRVANRTATTPAERLPETDPTELAATDRHLCSTADVIGYRIDATDGRIGQVDDFLFDEATWMLRFLVVDTRLWIPGKHVLVAPDWVENVSRAERTVAVALNQRTLRNSPEFSELSALSENDEQALYAYYASRTSPHERSFRMPRRGNSARHDR